MHPKKKRIIDIYGREPRNLNELAECVIKVISATNKVVGFVWDIKHGNVSNTHECPIDGVRNWYGAELDTNGSKHPRNYPGWMGRVWIRYAERQKSFGSDPFGRTLTYPGTGGFGTYSGPWTALYEVWYQRSNKKRTSQMAPQVYSWDYRFFDSDWPELYYNNIFDILKSESLPISHRFEWQDKETVANDLAFLADNKEKFF